MCIPPLSSHTKHSKIAIYFPSKFKLRAGIYDQNSLAIYQWLELAAVAVENVQMLRGRVAGK